MKALFEKSNPDRVVRHRYVDCRFPCGLVVTLVSSYLDFDGCVVRLWRDDHIPSAKPRKLDYYVSKGCTISNFRCHFVVYEFVHDMWLYRSLTRV